MVSRKNRTRLLAVLGGLFVISMTVGVDARINGITGRSQTGCTCHGLSSTPTVSVTISGIPPNYVPGNAYPLVVSVSGGPSTTNGGFDLSVTAGTLSTTDVNVQIISGEATHTSNAARTWMVTWQAPPVIAGPVTFYVAGNAVNGDGTSSGDNWNTNTYTSSPTLVNQPPTISLSAPDGKQDWSGGSPHMIIWTMNDDTTPPANLVVYLNYSSSSGSGPIAGPLVGVTSRSWTVPFIEANDAKVNATVIDASGLKGFSEAFVPRIDSTAPTVLSSSPTGTGVGVNAPVIITFSETMNASSVQASFSTTPIVSNWAFTWSTTTMLNDTVTATHDPFAPSTTYTATISTGGKDASDPGNALAAQHQWQFTTTFINTPPTIVINRPSGGVSLTGGSSHNVVWTASDAQDSAAMLKVWVNYTLTGAAPFDQQISGLQGVSGSSSPFTWTVPTVDSASVVLNATVVDTDGAKGYNISATFEIDSTPPAIQLLIPQDSSISVPTNTNLQVTWSESMNHTSTEASFSLQDKATWTPVAGNVSWAGNTMLFHPLAPLAANTQYQSNITAAASDASIPGNLKGTDTHWVFMTTNTVDLEKPTISAVTAIPNPQEAGLKVTVSAVVQDNVAVGIVWLNVTPPGQASSNVTMNLDLITGRYRLRETYSVQGIHNFVIWASDSSGNWNSSSSQFAISDLTPPAAPVDLVVEPQGPNALKLTWTANSEADLAGYRIYRSMQPGGPYDLLNTASLVMLTTYTDSGLESGRTYYYVVTAVDSSGNQSAASLEASGRTGAAGGAGPTATDWLLVSVIIMILVVVSLLVAIWRKKRKEQQKRKSEPPTLDREG